MADSPAAVERGGGREEAAVRGVMRETEVMGSGRHEGTRPPSG